MSVVSAYHNSDICFEYNFYVNKFINNIWHLMPKNASWLLCENERKNHKKDGLSE